MANVAFRDDAPNTVIPAKAGIHFATVKIQWIPAFAGMTTRCFRGNDESSTCSDANLGFNLSRISLSRRLLQPPIRKYLVDRAVGLHLAQRSVDLVEHRLVALAHGNA